VTAPAQTPFFRWLQRHWACTFCLMAVAFVTFGAASFNLVHLFSANIGFIAQHGMDAVREGALQQLGELLFSTALAVGFYLLFKTCELALVQRLANQTQPRKEP
jgi:hypothetical protein